MESLGEGNEQAKKVIITRKPMRTRFTDRTIDVLQRQQRHRSRLAARDLEAVDSRRQLNYYFSFLSRVPFFSQI